jgi:hypothetical protein
LFESASDIALVRIALAKECIDFLLKMLLEGIFDSQ